MYTIHVEKRSSAPEKIKLRKLVPSQEGAEGGSAQAEALLPFAWFITSDLDVRLVVPKNFSRSSTCHVNVADEVARCPTSALLLLYIASFVNASQCRGIRPYELRSSTIQSVFLPIDRAQILPRYCVRLTLWVSHRGRVPTSPSGSNVTAALTARRNNPTRAATPQTTSPTTRHTRRTQIEPSRSAGPGPAVDETCITSESSGAVARGWAFVASITEFSIHATPYKSRTTYAARHTTVTAFSAGKGSWDRRKWIKNCELNDVGEMREEAHNFALREEHQVDKGNGSERRGGGCDERENDAPHGPIEHHFGKGEVRDWTVAEYFERPTETRR
ncbi:hypothetical protein C8R47DRAFT_1064069 [Mycena vitilis]|nr:hypothetical protein C8R47DRAFT_1064069 [Mycena vitilis]